MLALPITDRGRHLCPISVTCAQQEKAYLARLARSVVHVKKYLKNCLGKKLTLMSPISAATRPDSKARQVVENKMYAKKTRGEVMYQDLLALVGSSKQARLSMMIVIFKKRSR